MRWSAYRAARSASASKTSERNSTPLPEGADIDLQDILSVAPELKAIPPGPYRSREGSGTPSGTFLGIPGSGKHFKIMTIDVHTVEDGKIKRAYHVEDWAGVMRQLSGGT